MRLSRLTVLQILLAAALAALSLYPVEPLR